MDFLRRAFLLVQICTIILCAVVLGKFAIEYRTHEQYWGNDFQKLLQSLNFNSLISDYCLIDKFEGVIQQVVYGEQDSLKGFILSTLAEDRSFNKNIFLTDITDKTGVIIDDIQSPKESLFLQPEVLRSQNSVYLEICSQSSNADLKGSILKLTITQVAREND